jgi:hypothetical protein
MTTTVSRDSIPPPTQAPPLRRALHAVLAFLGWVMFVYWWWLVFKRVDPHELRFTAWFVGVSLLVVVLATAAWAWHNLEIFRQRGPRRGVRAAAPKFARDRVGREVSLTSRPEDLQQAAIVTVRLTGASKTYETARAVPPAPRPGPR